MGGTSSHLVHLDLGPVPWQDRAGYVLATGTVHLFSGGNAQLSCVHRVTGSQGHRAQGGPAAHTPAHLRTGLRQQAGSLGTGSTLPPAAGVWSWLLSEPRPYI